MVDISLSGLQSGRYAASIRASGDVSLGSKSVGPAWRQLPGDLVVGSDGRGAAVVVGEGWKIWEIVGRAFAIERLDAAQNSSTSSLPGKMVLGVIARSAGVWENDKMVCSCSGKTVWEERKEYEIGSFVLVCGRSRRT